MPNFKNVYNNITNFLGDTSVRDEDKTGALLFTNSKNDNKFGQVYLFSRFGVCQNNSFSVQSEITSNFTEENYAIQDHWSIKPKQYSLSGLIGEIVYNPPTKFKSFVQKGLDTIKPLSILSPTLDSYTQSIANVAQAVESSVDRYTQIAKQAFQNFNNIISDRTSNQEFVKEQLQDLMENRQLCTVYTPYGQIDNLAIIGINISQGADTKYQSTLEVQFQEWRSTEILSRKATKDELSEWAAIQQSIETNNGVAATQNTELSSTLYKTGQAFGVIK